MTTPSDHIVDIEGGVPDEPLPAYSRLTRSLFRPPPPYPKPPSYVENQVEDPAAAVTVPSAVVLGRPLRVDRR